MGLLVHISENTQVVGAREHSAKFLNKIYQVFFRIFPRFFQVNPNVRKAIQLLIIVIPVVIVYKLHILNNTGFSMVRVLFCQL